LVRDGVIDEKKLIELLSVNPARILGVKGGNLSVGAVADVTVINPDLQFSYTEEQVVSKSKNSPFLGARLQGRAVYTIMGGRITHRLA
ncbi:MAG: dihydroorotase, partial [Candidatus Electrothrix sp. AUS4]|nr:dihydroorotase [Candidatus Electrothrix sp. AUS4]